MKVHYSLHHPGNITLSSERWASKLVEELHNYGLTIWNYRNSVVHGDIESDFMTKEEARKQIARCFEMRHFLGEEYSGLFATTPSDRLRQKTQTIRLWIATIDAVHKEKSDRLQQETRQQAQN